MGLRWHLPLPGPFSVSGRVFPRTNVRRTVRRAIDAASAAEQRATAERHREAVARAEQRAEERAASRRYLANVEALRTEEARLAERHEAAERLAELEATAIVHERDGMPGSAVEFRRMAAEYRAQRPDIAALVVLPDDEPEPEPVALDHAEEARQANARVARGETRAAGANAPSSVAGPAVTREITRSLFGERRR